MQKVLFSVRVLGFQFLDGLLKRGHILKQR